MDQQLYRQGDVLFKSIPKLPPGERKTRKNGVAAYGEVTLPVTTKSPSSANTHRKPSGASSTKTPNGRNYIIRVPPDQRTVRGALAWSFNVPENRYILAQES